MLKVTQVFAFLLGAIFLLVGESSSSGQNTNASSSSSDVQTVAFCELVRHPQTYEGKVVRVRAIFSSEFEKSALSAPDCPAEATWLHVPDSYASCTKRKVQKKFEENVGGPGRDIVIVGRFESKGNFGHLGMYPYRFVATCVESIQPLGHFRNLPDQKK
jgi:hypothetical protein